MKRRPKHSNAPTTIAGACGKSSACAMATMPPPASAATA